VRVRGLWVGVGAGAGVGLVAGVGLGEVAVVAVLLDPHPTRRRETANRPTTPIRDAFKTGSMALGGASATNDIEPRGCRSWRFSCASIHAPFVMAAAIRFALPSRATTSVT
jgi:hypothetical protein